MIEIESFLAYAEERLGTDKPLPCEPEDYAAMLVYLMALVPEYRLVIADGLARDQLTDRAPNRDSSSRSETGRPPPRRA
jgi:hypothetical protein